MQYTREITITEGSSRRSTIWKANKIQLSDLYERLRTPVRGAETLSEYMKLPKVKQDELKDIGGFVGGTLLGQRRKASAVTGRELVTLDFDNMPAFSTKAVIEKLGERGFGFCIYSTRKHSANKPRLRIIIPLSRMVSADEYEPVARKLCEMISMQYADPSTFEASRLMYWPSCCADTEYIYHVEDKPLVNPDKVLALYEYWHNWEEWPQIPGTLTIPQHAAKQSNPLEKPGIVGVFNRCYSIREAIDRFLPGVYVDTDDENRLTFANGSCTAGAVLYNNGTFLYSHHATDPCSGKLVNAFDLVRIHKFDDLDTNVDYDTPINKYPSFAAMLEFAEQDKGVAALNAREKAQESVREYAAVAEIQKKEEIAEQRVLTVQDVTEELEKNKNGDPKPTINNAVKILEKDPSLSGQFAMNEFSNCVEVTGALPWNQTQKRRRWTDTDNNGLYWYLETVYRISNRGTIDSALDLYASRHTFNEVQDFIDSLNWDGVERLDTLLIDTLGAEDTTYTRAVTRKMFTAAIARAMEPGVKFDTMLILVGPQGYGKSYLLDRMSMGWFNDSIRTFEGKEASELLPGAWLIEIAELDAFRKTDVSRVKQFLTLRSDRYRAAYGRNVNEYPRRCVFFGTCNQQEFLMDPTGNRRFWPVDIAVTNRTRTPWDLTENEIRQIWAEAKMRWMLGESLILTGETAQDAVQKQEQHREAPVSESLIQVFVERPVPDGFDEWDIAKRIDYWNGMIGTDLPTKPRTKICSAEIWCEVFGGQLKDCDRNRTREINQALERMPNWHKNIKIQRFGPYKQQRGYNRVNIPLTGLIDLTGGTDDKDT